MTFKCVRSLHEKQGGPVAKIEAVYKQTNYDSTSKALRMI